MWIQAVTTWLSMSPKGACVEAWLLSSNILSFQFGGDRNLRRLDLGHWGHTFQNSLGLKAIPLRFLKSAPLSLLTVPHNVASWQLQELRKSSQVAVDPPSEALRKRLYQGNMIPPNQNTLMLCQSKGVGLGVLLSSEDHLLLLQRTQASFSTLTWLLSHLVPRDLGSDALF